MERWWTVTVRTDNRKIGFIGAGKVGVTLGAYFRSKGLDIGGYTSRSRESAQAAAAITSTHAFACIQDLVQECSMIFVTTPDNQIKTVLKHLGIVPRQYEHLYRDLSMRLVKLSMEKHPERDYTEIWKCLEGYSSYGSN